MKFRTTLVDAKYIYLFIRHEESKQNLLYVFICGFYQS